MHDLYSITVLINLYRSILIYFNDFLEKKLITLAHTSVHFFATFPTFSNGNTAKLVAVNSTITLLRAYTSDSESVQVCKTV
jgi:hypothetical protein